MPKRSNLRIIDRVIDANLNRTKEGLRACEEVTRFILNSRSLTLAFKKARHNIDAILKLFPDYLVLIQKRESQKDVGKNLYVNELKREGYQDIFFANIQRVKESLRVLEEFSKLKNTNIAIKFKKIRYGIYELEKKVAKRIASLRYRR